ncbi:MAG TPA: 2-oxoacid:ferredoxin oxidoreductase subunit beta, partial [Nitrosarchaeum sp.]|nr:2-oxoacid:ferredoxin oxidoreductase subunit beta [Nitrosarchaeum sp.]
HYDYRVHYNDETEDNEKMSQAMIKSLEWGNKIPIGIFYQNELISEYSTRLIDKIPNYLENPPSKQKISENGLSTTDVSSILDSLRV